MTQPLCFVHGAGDVDGAIEAAGLEPFHGDATKLEAFVLCPFAVVDDTNATPDVRYALGLRDGVLPGTTIRVGADVDRDELTRRLVAAQRDRRQPIFELMRNFPAPDIARLSTDVFRDRITYSPEWKAKLAAARKQGIAAVRAIEAELGDLQQVEAAVLVDLFLSYRAVSGWSEMIALAETLPKPLASVTMMREQLAFGLNRAGRDADAEQILLDVLKTRGDNSETCSLLGRIYKDRWLAAEKNGDTARAPKLLDGAIQWYLRGFMSDWRDAFPGINSVMLMDMKGGDPRQATLIPIVRFAVEHRIASGEYDFWDRASLIELAVLARDEEAATAALQRAVEMARERWEPESTARTLRTIQERRERRGEADPWLVPIIEALEGCLR